MVTEKEQKSNILIALLALVSIIAIVTIVGFFMLKTGPEIIEGQAEVTEYRVSSKVPGRILEFRVTEGQKVQVGDTLAILEAPDVYAKLEQAKAATAAAEAQNIKAMMGARKEVIQSAFEMLQKAKAGKEVMDKTYTRVKNLHEKGVLPTQKLDEAEAQYHAALATEKAAQSQYDMAVNGAQWEDKSSAAALVLQAQGAVAEVESYVNETYLIAQLAGEVEEIFPQLGELVGSGAPIMNVAIMDDLWITFNVREDLLSGLNIGQEFSAFIPALDKKEVTLKVTHMKDVGTYAAWKATKTAGQYDLKTFQVKTRPTERIENLRAGMSVISLKKQYD